MDASALVAIVAREPGYIDLASRITEDGKPIWSVISRWETVRALCRLQRLGIEEAGKRVSGITADFFALVPIGAREAELALEAHRIYGKGNHPAELNMGDCFAYACAKANGAALLYKGNDFARTDLA